MWLLLSACAPPDAFVGDLAELAGTYEWTHNVYDQGTAFFPDIRERSADAFGFTACLELEEPHLVRFYADDAHLVERRFRVRSTDTYVPVVGEPEVVAATLSVDVPASVLEIDDRLHITFQPETGALTTREFPHSGFTGETFGVNHFTRVE